MHLSLAILLTAVFAGSAWAGDSEIASPIPLAKGTRWVYEASVKWTPLAGDGLTGVQSARFRWTSEVLDCFQNGSAQAAVVHAFPTEVIGMDPAKPSGYCVLLLVSNLLHSAWVADASAGRKMGRAFVGAPAHLPARAQELLELPLQTDKRWAVMSPGPPREDGYYCWRVESQQARKLSIRGLPADKAFTVTTVAFRTNPDHQVIELVPGVGITRLEYEHHGTVASADARLVEFRPPKPEPKPVTGPKR